MDACEGDSGGPLTLKVKKTIYKCKYTNTTHTKGEKILTNTNIQIPLTLKVTNVFENTNIQIPLTLKVTEVFYHRSNIILRQH